MAPSATLSAPADNWLAPSSILSAPVDKPSCNSPIFFKAATSINDTIWPLSLLYTALAAASVNLAATGFDFSLTIYSNSAEWGLLVVIETTDSLKFFGITIPA